MGFLDYAWLVSLQKDNRELKILLDPSLGQPTLERDPLGFTSRLPKVHFLEDGSILFLGQKFAQNAVGRSKVGRLFRASVLHLTAHTLVPLPEEVIVPHSTDSITEAFAKSLARDICFNAFLQTWHPDKLLDIAYANALAYCRLKQAERIYSPSTRIMTALLSRINFGEMKGSLASDEALVADAIYHELMITKETFATLFSAMKTSFVEILQKKIRNAVSLLEPFGPFLEAPSLPHTEQIGPCSIFAETETETCDNICVEQAFWKIIDVFDCSVSKDLTIEGLWKKEQDAEVSQAFDSEKHEDDRRKKILSKIEPYAANTKFRSVGFPEEDYTQYLRAKNLVRGTSRRLLDVLRTAMDYMDEDPRQEMGQLDLSAVIQAIASNKPATDVFTLDQYLKQSFAWSIVLDVSGSMKCRGEYARGLAIAVAEAAKELMMDATSWTFFAFSDKLYILKDSTESYSQRVRARIGGLRFEGLTYIPDAVYMAGKMLAKRFEEQRILVAISDGWPYGYDGMSIDLRKNVDELLRNGVIVIGIGVETDLMGNYFRLNSSVYSPKDLVKKFAQVFGDASEKARET
jgi:Mg-chelatase subunit ChlD